MKKFELDLSEYKITVKKRVKVDPEDPENKETRIDSKEEIYPLRENLSGWLRMAGVFKTGEEIAEAIVLGRTLEKVENDSVVLDEREASILKKCLNKHLGLTEAGKATLPLGGTMHEEAILRIFTMKEVT
jgi:hypothetical protein